MVSDAETQGGAAIAASRLAAAMTQSGHRISRLVATPDEQTHSWQTYSLALSFPLPPIQRLTWHALRPDGRERFGNRLLTKQLDRWLAQLRPDAINLHNIHFTFHPRWSPTMLRTCVAHAPTVWTLHDMWSFTGRCVYNYGCEMFVRGCDATCPTAEHYPVLPRRAIAPLWHERRALFAELQRQGAALAAVTPSQWLAREAQKGMWAGWPVQVIPYGLRLDLYRPLDRAAARAQWGLTGERPVLLFAAQNLTDPRKGWPLLEQALSRLACGPATLLALGNGELPPQVGEVEVRCCNYIGDEQEKAVLYNAADLLVHPAPVDNAPLVVAEALACGLPVAGFAIGGMPEMVIPERTGWLASEVGAEALAQLLTTALRELRCSEQQRAACRSFAESRFDFEVQAQRYVSLFSSLASARSTRE